MLEMYSHIHEGAAVFGLLLGTFWSVLSALDGSGEGGRNSTGGAIRVRIAWEG